MNRIKSFILTTLIGAFVRTRSGHFIFSLTEGKLLQVAPEYNMSKDTVL